MIYFIGGAIAIALLYFLAWIIGILREARMLNDLASRLPQTPAEWEAERELEWRHWQALDEADATHEGYSHD